VELEARLQAVLLLTLAAAKAFSDAAPAERPPYSQAYHYARLLTHVVKNMAAWASIDITRYSMELMGGIGFLEEYPMAKLHRDALVTAIWEGTSNIQALDMAEVFYKKEAGKSSSRIWPRGSPGSATTRPGASSPPPRRRPEARRPRR
jgi:acyl-CoA dehydrogenase